MSMDCNAYTKSIVRGVGAMRSLIKFSDLKDDNKEKMEKDVDYICTITGILKDNIYHTQLPITREEIKALLEYNGMVCIYMVQETQSAYFTDKVNLD